jgi:hypothetical protein
MPAVPVLTFFFFGYAFNPADHSKAIITGTVEPAEAYPVICVIDGNEAVAQQEAERNGEFSVQVPTGTFGIYDVSVPSGEEKDPGVR